MMNQAQVQSAKLNTPYVTVISFALAGFCHLFAVYEVNREMAVTLIATRTMK
jgi:hypothetical protein